MPDYLPEYCYGCMRKTAPGERVCPVCGWEHGGGNKKQPAFALPCGTQLHAGKYIVGRVLGQGGFGITYVGLDLSLELKVAIKEFYPTGSVSRSSGTTSLEWHTTEEIREIGKQDFVKEARKMAKIQVIPNVVSVRDVFYENETAYIVMDFVEGETLHDRLMKTGVMAPADCLKLLRPAMEALGRAHRMGLVHRDISPDNIMIDREGWLWLLDLGAAKEVKMGDNHNSRSSIPVMRMGFSPPEQISRNGTSGPWTDVYAMCATFCWCMTGELLPDAVNRLMGGELKLPDVIPAKLQTALRHGLMLKPSERIQTMEALLAELDQAIEVKSQTASESEKQLKPSNIPSPIAETALQSPVFPIEKTEKNTAHDLSGEGDSSRKQTRRFPRSAVICIAAIVLIAIIVVFSRGKANRNENLRTQVTDTPVTSLPTATETIAVQAEDSIIQNVEKSIYAILYTDGEMVFQNDDTEEPERETAAVYLVDLDGYQAVFDPDGYVDRTTAPWYSMCESIQLVSFETEVQPQSTAYWFCNCKALKEIHNLEKLNTSDTTEMGYMFWGCVELNILDISSFDTSNVTDTNSMFCGCSNLTTIYASDSFSAEQITDSDFMFSDCFSLTGSAGTAYDDYQTDKGYARIDEGIAAPGYFSIKNDTVSYIVTFDANGGTVAPTEIAVNNGEAYGELPVPVFSNQYFEGWYTMASGGSQIVEDTLVSLSSNQTLYAHWTADAYTVTWKDENGTILEMDENVPYGTIPEYNSTTPMKTDTAQYSYVFDGWSPELSAVTGNTVYSAVFRAVAKSYTVTFNYNGGSAGLTSKTVTNGAAYGELPAPVWWGHAFTGWFTAAAGGTQITAETTVNLSSDQTLYAGWTADTYTVTWKNENGMVLETDENVAYGTLPEFNSATPVKAETAQFSYVFDGWSPAISSVTGDTVYTAVFRAITKSYTITFNPNGGTVSPTNKTVTNGMTYGALPVPVWWGHTFAGWFTSTVGGSQINADTTVNLTFDQTLYAQWITDTYTITWLHENGTVLEVDENVPYGAIPEYNGATPMKDDAQYSYVFDGWTPLPTTVTGNTVYTAVFHRVEKSYIVTFNSNGGSVNVISKTVTYGAAYGELPTPEWWDHIFIGWFTSAYGGTQIFAETPVYLSSNQTLYAQWTTVETVVDMGYDMDDEITQIADYGYEIDAEMRLPAVIDPSIEAYYTVRAEGGSDYFVGALIDEYVLPDNWYSWYSESRGSTILVIDFSNANLADGLHTLTIVWQVPIGTYDEIVERTASQSFFIERS